MTDSTANASSSSERASAGRWHPLEYVLEALEIGLFMFCACAVVVSLEHPASPWHALLPEPALRRLIVGLAMGVTVILIVYSPLGKRSGAHMNPALTLAFLRLGKIPWPDAIMYVLAQFSGASAGVGLAELVYGDALAHEAVAYVVTVPATGHVLAAFLAELAISAGLMALVLALASSERLSRFTGVFCGALVATYITFEAPLSGMSMNPARSFGSALLAGRFEHLWLYGVAPTLGMLGAAECFARLGRARPCAKLRHDTRVPCIFCSAAAHPSLP
jgi:aquaporin Z